MGLELTLRVCGPLGALNQRHGSLQGNASVAAIADPQGVYRDSALRDIEAMRENLDRLEAALKGEPIDPADSDDLRNQKAAFDRVLEQTVEHLGNVVSLEDRR